MKFFKSVKIIKTYIYEDITSYQSVTIVKLSATTLL